MASRLSRREVMQIAALAGLSPVALRAQMSGSATRWPPPLGSGTPKICLGGRSDEAGMRQLKQVGVDYVLMGGPRSPWTVTSLGQTMDRYKAAGITVINLMIGGMNDIIRGGPNRDQEIENIILSIRAAGEVGLPVIEYNFYANRLMEGYKEEIGRAGAGYTAYDYELSKNLPPSEGVGTHTRADQLKRAQVLSEGDHPGGRESERSLCPPPE